MDDSSVELSGRTSPPRSTNEAHASIIGSSLPSDILLNIFFILRDLRLGSSAQTWDWINLTKVCRNWRNVTLECSSLWCEIYTTDISHLERVQAFLKRSKHTELKVNIEVDRTRTNEILGLFECHMWRVREFKVTVVGGVFEKVKACLVGMTHRVKVLALRYKTQPGHLANSFSEYLYGIPDYLPDIHLDSLSLHSVLLPWMNQMYHGLTNLTIIDEMRGLEKFTVWKLIDILEHCPKLRYLHLKSIFPLSAFRNIDISQIEARILAMPHLRDLILSDIHITLCQGLFAMFAINNNTRLDVSLVGYPYFASLPPVLPSNTFVGRKECTSICVMLTDTSFTLQSNYILDSDGCNITSDTRISVEIPEMMNSYQIMVVVPAFLRDPFWKTAEDALVSFNKITSPSIGYMNANRWLSLLIAVPRRKLKSLVIKLPLARDPELQCSNELLKVLNILLDESNLIKRLPELVQLTISHADFSAEIDTQDRNLLLMHMENRSKRMNQTCRVSFQGCMLEEGRTIEETEEFVLEPLQLHHSK